MKNWSLTCRPSMGNHHHCDANMTREPAVSNATAVRRDAGFAGPVLALLTGMMVVLIALIVCGNALVIVAFKMDKSLRKQSNYFLLNLAISDFLVGAFCIPVYMPYILTGKWMLGKGLCKLWLVVDYLLCTASVFNIVLISYDRYLSVTKAVSYRAKQGMTHFAVLKIAVVWILAFLLYGPSILFWEQLTGRSRVPDDECFAEFYYTWYFLLSASVIEFFVPFLSVAFFNISIYINIRRRRLGNRSESKCHNSATLYRDRTHMSTRMCWNSLALKNKSTTDGEKRPESDGLSMRCVQRSRLRQDKKIAKSLAIIVCVFAVCWAPYTLLMIVRAACRGDCVSQHWYEVTFWLLWLNSAINPFLYPLCHSSFRRAFFKILCPRQSTTIPLTDHTASTHR
ncbi:histamine H3 receptor [Danio rerio]|uniref:Histamine H3 receptor n=1 Tax=Danio rerio TaxID=7955 RepID=F1Q6J0_DANRE|nr:histamine H3 receptor-like [Danio rerio]|eukprot:XP_002667517.2 histamine H3 receptor-like [Danio rerio]